MPTDAQRRLLPLRALVCGVWVVCVGCAESADDPPWLDNGTVVIRPDGDVEMPEAPAGVTVDPCDYGEPTLELGFGATAFEPLERDARIPLTASEVEGVYLPLAVRTLHFDPLVQLQLEVWRRNGDKVASLVGNLQMVPRGPCGGEALDLRLSPLVAGFATNGVPMGDDDEMQVGLRAVAIDLNGRRDVDQVVVTVFQPEPIDEGAGQLDTGPRVISDGL